MWGGAKSKKLSGEVLIVTKPTKRKYSSRRADRNMKKGQTGDPPNGTRGRNQTDIEKRAALVKTPLEEEKRESQFGARKRRRSILPTTH